MNSPAFTMVAIAAVVGFGCDSAIGQIFTRTITYTRFFDAPNVKQALLTYDVGAGTTSFTTPTVITHTPGADGIIFVPDGDVIVGGQGDAVYKVQLPGPSFTSVNAGGSLSFHVMLDPSGTKVWTAGNLGSLASVPLYPFANGTPHPLSGDDVQITHIVFAGNTAYYTASLAFGNGNFGRIDLNTFTTTRLFSNVRWAHGATYDCYTGDIMVFANDTIAQFDPATETVVAQLDLSSIGPFINMDQGTSDGEGHIYAASNTGYLVFADITISGNIANPDFVDVPFLDTFLDDVAPECGLGAQTSCPRSQGYWKTHQSVWPVNSLTVGCQTYSAAQMYSLLNMPPLGDASVILAKQLIAALLNVANNSNNWPLLQDVVDQVDLLLCSQSGPMPLGINSKTALGAQMTALAHQLEDYNLGRLSPACSTGDHVRR